MNYLELVKQINWTAISAIASWIQLLIVFVPIIIYFFFSKFNYIDYWILNKNENGMEVVLHNKSKSSLFLLKEEIVKKNQNIPHTITIPFDTQVDYVCIKPDETTHIIIDYGMLGISQLDTLILTLEFGGKKLKQHKKLRSK